MDVHTEKSRLLNILNGQSVDRPSVICPGGMMNAAVTEVVEPIIKSRGGRGNHNIHSKDMVEAARRVHDQTGFENYGVPFCMTAEVEPLGIQTDYGDAFMEPRVTQYTELSIDAIVRKGRVNVLEYPRMKAVVEAIDLLKNESIPVIGNITGHISTASSAVDPNVFFKSLIKKPMDSHALLDYINAYLIEYAKEMVRAGADIIAISDPTATGEILGERMFRAFALPYYKVFLEALRPLGIPIIFHMCGKSSNVIEAMNEAGFQALSFDSVVNMKMAREKVNCCLMGNVNTQALNFESCEKIESLAKTALESGVDIVSPACGLGMGTPVSNIRAMTQYVKAYRG